MKKLVLFVMAVMAFAGMSVAQDVWTSGYYTDASTGRQQAAVYKNATKQYNSAYAAGWYGDCTDLDRYNGDTYWVSNSYTSDGNFNRAKIQKNSSTYSDWYGSQGSGSHVYDLYRFPSGTFIATGCINVSDVRTAVAWKNDVNTVHRQMGNGTYESCAFGATGVGGYLYTCGYQYTNSSTYHGVIWRENSVFHSYPNGTKIFDVAHFNGYFYAVGTAVVDGATKLRVWETPDDGSTGSHILYTLVDENAYGHERVKIYVDEAGDIYVTGQIGSQDKVYKNDTQLYSTSRFFQSVLANTNGVYYVGGVNDGGKVWKDGSVLYSPSGATRITNIRMDTPPCTNSEIRSLPFTENFENGSTSWPCWTTIDVDNNNGTDELACWRRTGKRLGGGLSGNYSAMHAPHTDAYQNGFLVTPRLFLQPGQSETKLTFKSKITTANYYVEVYVSLNPDPTNTASYTRVYQAQQTSTNTTTITVDLKAYQGQAVYIGFRYYGSADFSWIIDDVNVTESFSPCTASNAPYTCDFSGGFPSWYCWTAYDADKTPQYYYSGGSTYEGTWQYDSDNGCMRHHYGPNGTTQTGWLFSKRITLPTGEWSYTLSFKSRSVGSGTGRRSTVWLAQNESGAPVVSHFTTKIWEDEAYSSSWNTYTVDLTPYKGKTVTIGFKYEGNYAHTWYVDDFAITKEVTQYNITANSNNTNWGTVTGGGSYASGATCVLHATAKPGYVFQEWRLNGTPVSVNPNYSFIVTGNATYTAYFGAEPVTYYTITTAVTPAGAGTVTVNGGNIHEAGSTTTLTATANPGYTFAHWQDGNTDNPRTITVTGDATYTATFTQDTYTITTAVTPAGAGTVSGGGNNFHYGDTPTLTATPSSTSYEFAGWNDGNTENPRMITVTGNATYTAVFNEVGVTMYSVTASVEPAGAGSVTGTGTFEAGTTISLQANANPGYTFSHWQDGNTTNPRSVTVTDNLVFTAYFTQNEYVITVTASPAAGGVVSGGGSYHYGDYATLTATANTGYEFQGWSDGSTENPHPVMVTGTATYTATFSASGSTYYNVSAYVSPAGSGTVNGTGSFPAGTTITLTAVANSGYVFDHWNDGSTTNPRTVTVNSNMSFTAYFTSNQYTITANASPAAGGTVTGGGSYPYGASVTLTATANSGYSFMQWSDGVTANPRTVTVTGNATYTALFMSAGGDTFMLTVTSGNPLLGQVMGSGVYPAGASVEIKAVPASYARFVKWDDGNTENPRTVVVDQDLEFVAEFVRAQQYTITVESSNSEWGYVLGGGTFNEGTQIQITAIPNDGYVFTSWNDGNIENPRTVTVTGDATYTAQFAENAVTTYTVTLICNTSEGSVSGGGPYIGGTTAIIQAFPNPGYVFTKWSDENTDNPRAITVNSDMTLVAFFATGVDENTQANLRVYPNPAKESIFINGIEANTQIEIYNSLGELVKVLSVSENQEINVRDLAAGLYMVHFGNATLRFVKEQ